MTVLELLRESLARLGETPAVPFLEAVETVSQVITRLLLDANSDYLKKGPDDITIGAGQKVALPAGFCGFRVLPYCVEERKKLTPVDEEEQLSYTGTVLGFYDLTAGSIGLFPAQTSSRTLRIIYNARPSKVVSFTDTLPFGGDFDFLFRDATIAVSNKGIAVTSDPAFLRHMEDQVRDVIRRREPAVYKRNGYFD